MKEQTTERFSLETKDLREPFLQRLPKNCSHRTPFAVFSHPGIQRLPLQLAADLGVTLRGANTRAPGPWKLQGGFGDAWRGRVPKGKAPQRAAWGQEGENKALVESPSCWGEKNTEHLQRKAAASEQRLLTRHALWSATFGPGEECSGLNKKCPLSFMF